MNNYKLVAMIPARMGSKRIPKKNIRFLLDKPLIQYPVDLALKSDAFDSIWVNTESVQLGEICRSMGVNFHQRPEALANDQATNREFVYEFLQKHDCDYVVMVNPTSPLLTKETMNRFIEFVQSGDYDIIHSVIAVKTESFYKGEPINFDKRYKINSQFLEPVKEIMWALTAWKRDFFLAAQDSGLNPIFEGKIGLFEVPKDESADLDTEEDWNIAEGLLNARISRQNNEKKYLEI